jgi:DNA polymerase I-like protein with 3'-5' exonuclease and polymerase domains
MLQLKDIKTSTVLTLLEWGAKVKWLKQNYLIVDVETYLTSPEDGKLLGVSLCSPSAPADPLYIALQWYDFKTSTWFRNEQYDSLLETLTVAACKYKFIGHNYAYDKSWLDYVLGIETKWQACTRLMWHMSSAPEGPRGYGLEEAQKEVLRWDDGGKNELHEQIAARGGSVKGGDHYLADLDVMGRYACLDAASTALLYNELARFFDEHDYWGLLDKMVAYSWLLQQNTACGVRVDVKALEDCIERLTITRAAWKSHFMELAHNEIAKLERFWKEDRAAKYVNQAARDRFLGSWELQRKFNPSSDKDKRELFYETMRLPVVLETDGGKPATGLEAVSVTIRKSERSELAELLEAYTNMENAETLLNSFASPWLHSTHRGRLHPRFNPCGTVSYRLSGFKPYLLNAPFDEIEVMSCLTCDEGWEGVHADFASIEPAVTAHYSQDPSLLKVFKEGKGDVYLDLACTLFPEDKQLRETYDPTVAASSAVKEALKRPRSIAKVIHLATQYTGTKYTISKNLTFAGFPTSLTEADGLVKAYWSHFSKVARMNEALFQRFERTGLLRNVVGRIIRVPATIKVKKRDGTIWDKPMRYKDLPNRFIQSSAHDILSLYVLEISRLCKDRGLQAKPVILDCHDSTSWQAPKAEVKALEQVFRDALIVVNEEVNMTVLVRIEMKRFTTLAGVKGDEV